MERGTYQQVPGNFRYKCPSCGKAAIHSARLPKEPYTCPITKAVVTVDDVEFAQVLSDVYRKRVR